MSHHRNHSGGRSISANPLGKSARNRIQNITGTQVQRLLLKLDVLSPHLEFLSSLPMQELTSSRDYTPGEVEAGSVGVKGAKEGAGMGRHVLQESSILGHLRRIGAFDNIDNDELPFQQKEHIAIEFGAGTGRLSERLQRCTKQGMRHILLDRQEFAPNQCRDGAMRNRAAENSGSSVERITADIADFQLGEYCSNNVNGGADGADKLSCTTCFCFSKHLCGPACDLAISALGRVDVPSHNRPPFAFATCCHYLCTWESFSGKDYWLRLGLTEEDFEVSVAASQWYSIKGGKKKNQHEEDVTEGMCMSSACGKISQRELMSMVDDAGKVLRNIGEDELRPGMPSKEFERTFAREEKAKLGGIVKRLLDLSRVARLQEFGYEAELVLYTTRSIENRLLVGRL